ncbi:MAG: hypothetical protein KGS61_05745 [Verrucomicrobia bacterium]|nr:hypothetical protein [Verrucomicrobiota bacterium]
MLYQWLCLGGVMLLCGLLFWLRTRIRYRITHGYLKVQLLGLTVRRVRLTDIERISKRRAGWAENWWSTWRPFRRTLIVRRMRGLRKDFVITPRYRYEFKAKLEAAVQRAKAAEVSKPGPAAATSPAANASAGNISTIVP